MEKTKIMPRPVLFRVVLGALCLVAAPSHALVIKPVFDASINNHAQAATIKATIQSALDFYQATFSDPITVNITFEDNPDTKVATTAGTFDTVTYAAYRAALVTDATSLSDTTALDSLPKVAANPANGALNVALKKANLRALGLAGDTDSDGTIGLNLSVINFDRVTIDAKKFDLQMAVQHEVNEVLGFSSAILLTTDPYPLDLFRYNSLGKRTYTKVGDDADFSIDGGKTALARFNQDVTGDMADWWSNGGQTPQVQDAFFTPGVTPNMGVEITGLDVIGYTLSAPEPRTLSLLALGALTVFGVRRRRSEEHDA